MDKSCLVDIVHKVTAVFSKFLIFKSSKSSGEKATETIMETYQFFLFLSDTRINSLSHTSQTLSYSSFYIVYYIRRTNPLTIASSLLYFHPLYIPISLPLSHLLLTFGVPNYFFLFLFFIIYQEL